MFNKNLYILFSLFTLPTLTIRADDLNTLLSQAADHRNRGDMDASISAYKKATELDPNNFDIYFYLGNTCFMAGRYADAVTAYKKTIEIRPSSYQNRFNLALTYDNMKYTADAILTLEEILRMAPHYNKAKTLLAGIYLKKGDLNRAAECYESALATTPNDTDCLFNLATIQREKKQYLDAIINLKKTIIGNPSHQHAYLDLGYCYHLSGNVEKAVETYKQVLTRSPECHEARCNLAHMLRFAGNVDEALEHYEAMLKLFPDNHNLHYGYAESLLKAGRFNDGWREWESRWKRNNDSRQFAPKQWDGISDLRGKRVLLRAEYGHGDTYQFIRFAQLLKDMGATVIAEVQGALVKLLSLCPYLDKVISMGDKLPDFDAQIPVMSLPYKLNRLTEDKLVPQIPYITPDQTLVNYWKKELSRDGNFKIGICWESSTYFDSFRSPRSKKALHLATFAPLAQIPNVTLYSLQTTDARTQVKEVGFEVRDFGPDFDVKNGRYMDTAALMKSLDLVVTVDTSVAHLAGALGVPVWVVLPSVPDWRWMLDRDDTPWYPTMRLFRQQEHNVWDPVFNSIRDEISKQLTARSKKSDLVTAEISIGELIDKITILEIKKKFISDPAKLKNILTELEALCATRDTCIPKCPELDELTQQLYDSNQRLWDIEDACRNKERAKQFDDEFIQITRSVYVNNDERCAIKRKINNILGSRLIEEKSYAAY